MRSEISPQRVLIKALLLFVIVNLLYALVDSRVARASAYNVVFPGRTRLPFGISGDPFTVTVDHVDAMFASHLIAAPKQTDEFRVALIGDSAVWGEDLGAYEVISEQWNRLNIPCGEKRLRAYDLGYPHPSILKDLVLLEKATEYQPDLIIWFVTLNTLFSQRVNPFLTANHQQAAAVLNTYDIAFTQSKKFVQTGPSFWERTLIGRRSNLARQIKLQLLGIIWTATGADTNTLAPDKPPSFNIDNDTRYRNLQPADDIEPRLLLSALPAGAEIAAPVPLLIVNEPIFVAPQANEMVRYNAVYPRWAYDRYREAVAARAQTFGWNYLDLWDAVPAGYFSDTGLHLSADGERLLIQQINPVLQNLVCATKP
jgi:hypothetical protein